MKNSERVGNTRPLDLPLEKHGATDWFQIGKGVCQSYILSPCLFTLYAEYIMRNTGLEEVQAGIKITRRNITNLDPDILECEVKGALGSITTNKASGGDGIPVELFQILNQILKNDAGKN